ncbi:8-amino-7-oxononanoate synthase [Desulfurella amilsii]|uniref:8-amino-7-oxononanoate synthase n=1 Tax=Desulfurella amilsii TaxID=1562698 RepID=A0A1X4XYT6_9BACT|nr:pyridoxal phosphate-dependent aminotransferase family protein [Desulfurella amilsii]OSS42696.1 8-amino-7-oxononanoate synthase [Desulfurella amilsii]
MELFDKCINFVAYKEIEQAGLYPYFQPISSEQGTEVIINGKKILMLGSNSYLGLTVHPKVKQAAIDAIKKYGTGCAGSRFLNGTLDIHIELEEKLAKFTKKEKAVLFSTGFQANLGAIAGLVGKDDYVIIDKSDHASIVDGTKLSFGEVKRFFHNDMQSLEKVLQSIDINAGKLIVIDGVYSMDGDIANLPEIINLKKRYNARVMVDDAHAFGVIGKNGSGTASHFNLIEKTDIIMGTFSKSFASLGGFIAADTYVIDYLKHFARSLIFSASITPASCAAVLASLEIMQNEPELIGKLWANTNHMRDGLKSVGFDTFQSCTPIIPVLVGDDMKVLQYRKMLFEEGIFVNPVVSPAVPKNKALIRLSLMATHTFDQIDFALEKITKVGKHLGVI